MTAKILIVDDHPLNRQLIITLLEGYGYVVYEAQDGREGLDVLYSVRPDLVVVDLVMPVMDGYEFTRRLREDPKVCDTPVIFYTASSLRGKEAQELARMCGVRHVLPKPSEPEAIFRTVEAALAGAGHDLPQPPREEFNGTHLRVLSEKLTRKVYENKWLNLRLAALVEASTELFGRHDLRPMLEKFCHAARDIIGARYAIVNVQAVDNWMPEQIAHSHFPPSAADADDAILLDALLAEMQKHICLQEAVPSAREQSGRIFSINESDALLCSASTGKVSAWLYLKDKQGGGGFSKEDGWIAAALINQFAALYENQMLYERLFQRNRELQVEIEWRQTVKDDLAKSERHFRALIENSSDAIALLDRDFAILYGSPSTTQLLGYELDQFVGINAFDLLRPDVHEQIRKALSETFMKEMGNKAAIQTEVRHRDGSWRWMEGIFTNLLEDPSVSAVVVNYRDLTERKRAEEALKESEARLRLSAQAGKIGLWGWDLVTNAVYFSPEWKSQLGYLDEEVPNRFEEWERRVHPDDLAPTMEKIHGFLENPSSDYSHELRMRHRDGSWRWILTQAHAYLDDAGCPARMMGCHIDITQRKRAEEALRASEERFSKAFHSSPLPMSISTLDEGRFLAVNDSFLHMSGYDREELVGRTCAERQVWIDSGARTRLLSLLESLGTVRNREVRLRTRSGEVRTLLTSAERIEIDGQECLLTASSDITERQQDAEKLAASRERLRALTARLQSVREQERTSIAREIHDVLGQRLTGLKMDIAWLDKKLTGESVEVSREKLLERTKGMLTLVDETIRTVQDISSQLRPGVLDNIGLVAAVEWQAREFQRRTEIECECELPVVEPPLDGERATAIFRIFQEILTNVARHAGASHVRIRFTTCERELVLRVEDDGRGITTAEVEAPASLGLLGMNERAQLFGGEVVIERADSHGTVVTARMPQP